MTNLEGSRNQIIFWGGGWKFAVCLGWPVFIFLLISFILSALKQLATAEHHNETHCHIQTAPKDEEDPVCHSDEEELEACLSKVSNHCTGGQINQKP